MDFESQDQNELDLQKEEQRRELSLQECIDCGLELTYEHGPRCGFCERMAIKDVQGS